MRNVIYVTGYTTAWRTKLAEIAPSMEMRFFESYGNSPSIDWCGGTGSGERSLYRRGHARLILLSCHEADSLTM
jgi:hypothetical protein